MDLKREYDLVCIAWKFLKEFTEKMPSNPRENDDYWREVINTVDKLLKEHSNDLYLKDLLLANVSVLERIAKGEKA